MSRIVAIVVLLGALAAPLGPGRAEPLAERQRARDMVSSAERELEDGRITAQQFQRRCAAAAEVWAEDAGVQLALGTAWLLLEDDARAAGHLEAARRLDATLKPAIFWLAAIRERSGDVAAARTLYEACLEQAARTPEDRDLDARARAWLDGAPSGDAGFVTAEEVRCFYDGTCPPTRQLEIVRIATRSDGRCEQRLMLTVPFGLDRSNLGGAARKQLDELGRALRAGVAGDATLRMIGYASPDGDEAYNLALSRRRVDAVAAYLAERWEVPLRRIETSAAGEADPVRNRDGGINLERSRRVELVRGFGTVPCEDGAGP